MSVELSYTQQCHIIIVLRPSDGAHALLSVTQLSHSSRCDSSVSHVLRQSLRKPGIITSCQRHCAGTGI